MKPLVMLARRRHRRQQAAIQNRKIAAIIIAVHEDDPPGAALADAVRAAIAAGTGQVRTGRTALIAASDFPDARRAAVYAITRRAIGDAITR